MESIYAPATAPGIAGVSVVRISGPETARVMTGLLGRSLRARKAELVSLRDPQSGDLIDHCLALWFPNPASFTGEDVLELHLHGGRAVLDGALKALSSFRSVRPAEPGEFTKRAFYNDKLDLTEVEGLSDLIAAETEAQRAQALRQMDGQLSHLVEEWRSDLLRALAHMEADIDFPDEELGESVSRQSLSSISRLKEAIEHYLLDDHRGEKLRDGFSIAIIGPPNAGKSSLLNALAKRDVAIVSDRAGTTRDIIEIHLNLAGYPVTFADTAGLRDSINQHGDDIELEGMKRARSRAEKADLVLVLFSASELLSRQEEISSFDNPAFIDFISSRPSFFLLNKTDEVLSEQSLNRLENDLRQKYSLSKESLFSLSVKQDRGVNSFISFLEGYVEDQLAVSGNCAIITRERHRVALQDCRDALQRALAVSDCAELAAEDTRLAIRALGRITGSVGVEDLLDIIFCDFCLGK